MSEGFGPPADESEVAQFYDIRTVAFLGTPNADERTSFATTANRDDFRVLRRGGRVAGGLYIHRMGQWFGGRSVPMAGVAAVAVDAHARASGTGMALVRSTLADLHAGGFALSVLYPATQPVYRRNGYEQAGTWIGWRLQTNTIELRDRELDLRRAAGDDTDRVHRAYAQRARRTSGNLDRHERIWKRVLDDDPGTHAYLAARGSDVEGYVVFGLKYDAGIGTMQCHDFVALTPAAGRRILTFFAEHRSQVHRVQWYGPPADPVLLLLAEQSGAEPFERMAWMLRVVDVRGALAARGYPDGIDAELHLDVRDDVLPWNHGRFTLEVSGGKAKVRKGGRGRLRIDVRGLASLYTGYLSATELLVTGQAGGTARELSTADALFGGPSPWMPDFF